MLSDCVVEYESGKVDNSINCKISSHEHKGICMRVGVCGNERMGGGFFL